MVVGSNPTGDAIHMTVQQFFAAPFFFEVVLRSLHRAFLKSLNRDLIKLGSFIKKQLLIYHLKLRYVYVLCIWF